MKKWLKIIIGVIGVIALLFTIDLVCIFTIHRPLLAIKKDNETMYKGIFYDTYICQEFSIPQIKAKGVKYTCRTDSQKRQEKNNDETLDFYISKKENHDGIKYNDYITYNDRKYYLASNIEEFYVVSGKTMVLKAYITNFDHTLLNHSIKRITDEMTIQQILKDGGTTIYKSEDKDVTIIECKTLDGNDDIYIGDYSMYYNNYLMCK